MRSNAGKANRQADVDLSFAQVSAPQLELWLGLALLGWGWWSASRPGRTLPPGKTRYPLHRRLGGPQGPSGRVRKISPPTRIRPPRPFIGF